MVSLQWAPDNNFLGSTLRFEDFRCAATGKSSPIQCIMINSLDVGFLRSLVQCPVGTVPFLIFD